MNQNIINKIINNAVIANKNDYKNEKDLLNILYDTIKKNFDLFIETSKIDIDNNNGTSLDLKIIDNLYKKYANISPLINSEDKVTIDEYQTLSSNVYAKTGILLVLFDGNFYTILEMIILSILTHNVTIFAYNGYMQGTDRLLINFTNDILENHNLNKNTFQEVSLNNDALSFFNHFKTINKTIIIGDGDFINHNLKICSTNVIVSGYKNYDIYIEETNHLDIINKIIELIPNVNLYVKSDVTQNFDNSIVVDDIDEAITYINYNSSKYSSSIFTSDSENASKFIRNVNSKMVAVNASPSLQSDLDITQEDLLQRKKIVMPNIYHFDGTKVNFPLNDSIS